MDSNGPKKNINLEIRKRKFRWIGHTKIRGWGNTKGTLLWNPQGSRKRGRPKNSWRRSVIKEAGEVGMNYVCYLLINRTGKNS
jgi:hypothetical protein